ncbi:Holliday junction resolvase RuvX [Melioribacteraceae bacterium 4301-Me]|uniref:Holliday junction resolvase RuvX n=1 Tax=Pyranulibacter aquaticus TaxID=3163344 RepID=UPI0035991BC2
MEEKRILAIDYGEVRIGLAITDPLNLFAYPLTTLPNNQEIFKELDIIIKKNNIVKIVLGNPLKENGSEAKISALVKKFKDNLESKFNLKVELLDERYTSEIARKNIIESVTSKKKRRDKTLLDMNAAYILLQDYLKTVNNNKSKV